MPDEKTAVLSGSNLMIYIFSIMSFMSEWCPFFANLIKLVRFASLSTKEQEKKDISRHSDFISMLVSKYFKLSRVLSDTFSKRTQTDKDLVLLEIRNKSKQLFIVLLVYHRVLIYK